jgi:hypothetical protein
VKKYKEGVDFEWRKVDGANAKSRHFFTKAEKKARASKGSTEMPAKQKAGTKRKSTKASTAVETGSDMKYGPQNGRGGKRRSEAPAKKPEGRQTLAQKWGLDKKKEEETSLLRSNTPRRTKMVASDTTDDARAARGTGRLNMETRTRNPKPINVAPGLWKRVFNGGRGGMKDK